MRSNDLTITSIVEDTSYRHGFWAIHGVSFLIENNRYKILFDTGESAAVLLHNLKVLEIIPRQIDCLVISHGHVDHLGGLADFLPYLSHQPIYLLENALNDYAASYSHEYSNLPLFSDAYQPERVKSKILSYKNLKKISKPVQIRHNFWLTGPLVNEKGIKEQSLVISSSKGLIIITGCDHPGIKKTIIAAQKITGKKKIYALIGGFHLKEADEKEVRHTIDYLKIQGPEIIVPCHCTGSKATQAIKKAFGSKVRLSILGSFSVGDKIIL